MTNKLILIDGSSILSTSFYGTIRDKSFYSAKTEAERQKAYSSLLQTSTGLYTNGVYTMCKILLNLIKNQKPTHLAVAWDISRNTFRRDIFEGYKGNRKETPQPLKDQFALMQKILKQIGIAQFMDEKYEADDFLGSLTKKFEMQIPIYIYTKDQDMLQLVSEYTRLWLITSKADELRNKYNINYESLNVPKGAFVLSPIYVEEEYGLKPMQIIDYKALVGDSSDNILGVRGIGEKVAIPLLKEYGTIENLYDNIEGLNKKEEESLKKFFKEDLGINRSPLSYLLKKSDTELVGRESAFLSKKLATIKTDISEIQEETLCNLSLDINENAKANIFEELEMKNLIL